MSDPIHRSHNGWTNKFIFGYKVYKTVSQSVQESVSSTTEQSINPTEIALRDFSQHPGRPESYGRLHIRAHCENQSGHLQGCTKTVHHPANQLRCLSLDSHLCGAIFFLLITRGGGGEWSKSPYAQRQRDTGAGGQSCTSSSCACSEHLHILHYLNSGSTGNYSVGDRVQLPLYFPQQPTTTEDDVLFSLPIQRDESFLWAKPVSINIFCNYNQYI